MIVLQSLLHALNDDGFTIIFFYHFKISHKYFPLNGKSKSLTFCCCLLTKQHSQKLMWFCCSIIITLNNTTLHRSPLRSTSWKSRTLFWTSPSSQWSSELSAGAAYGYCQYRIQTQTESVVSCSAHPQASGTLTVHAIIPSHCTPFCNADPFSMGAICGYWQRRLHHQPVKGQGKLLACRHLMPRMTARMQNAR